MEGGGKEQVAIKLDGVPSRFEESPSRSIAPNFCNFRLMANIRIVTKKEALKRLLVLAINDEISFQPESSLLEFRLLAISNGKIGSGGLRGLEGFGFLWKVFE